MKIIVLLTLVASACGCATNPLIFRRVVGAETSEVADKFSPYNTIVLDTPKGNADSNQALDLWAKTLESADLYVIRGHANYTPSSDRPALILTSSFDCTATENPSSAAIPLAQGLISTKVNQVPVARNVTCTVRGTFLFTDLNGNKVHETSDTERDTKMRPIGWDPAASTYKELISKLMDRCAHQFASHYEYTAYDIAKCPHLPTTIEGRLHVDASDPARRATPEYKWFWAPKKFPLREESASADPKFKPDYKRAEEKFRIAVETAAANPSFSKKEYSRAVFLLGLSLEGQRKWEEAFKQYELAFSLFQDSQYAATEAKLNDRMKEAATTTPVPPQPDPTPPPPPTRTIQDDPSYIRSSPSVTNDNKITTLHRGDKVEVLEESGDWVRVKCQDGTIGWTLGSNFD